MKVFLIILLITVATSAKTQTLPLDVKQKLSSLLKLKHDYEGERSFSSKIDSAPYKAYIKAYNDIRQNREAIIAAIDEYLETDSVALIRDKTIYNWHNPISSNVNFISVSYYFRIVKYSLEKQLIMLPPLNEVPF